jgi:hypothetical protein
MIKRWWLKFIEWFMGGKGEEYKPAEKKGDK